MIEFFLNDRAKQNFAENNLNTFQLIWTLDTGWYEDRNIRRGGWSGVSRYKMINNNAIFIKRQENHCHRAWNTFFKLVPTFNREFENIQKFTRLGIPTLEVLYFGQRNVKSKLQAILVTEELEGFLPLDSDVLKRKLSNDIKFRKGAIQKIAEAVSNMHEQHLQHNCLYEKHIFLKQLKDGDVDVRLIDLEKVKGVIFRRQAMYRDLGALYRHSEGWSKIDYLRFFLYYQKEQRLSVRSKKMLTFFLKKVKNKINKKHKL